MHYSVELFLDPESSALICRLWAELAEVSGSRYMRDNGVHPHVALAVFEADSLPPRLQTGVELLAKGLLPRQLKPRGIDSFAGSPPVVYVGFETCRFLMDVHGRVAELLDAAGLRNHELYRTNRWMPHCTLAMRFTPSRESAVVGLASRTALEAPFQATSLGLVAYPPTRVICRRRLAGGTVLR